ncbi:MAG: SUMF1/EgtB/PvdO family nonheme iron enzyme [Verrucomicrobiales bacterium]|nr:SUMF1/EgtB/PvdO family nonheme iron enzyme [Verrucomicrobiales bacterium]
MSSDIERWEPPNDATAFESLCLDLWKDILRDPGTQKNGRRGQKQDGVDVFGRENGLLVGIQCKQKDGRLWSRVTVSELEAEVQAALQFEPALSRFILATTALRDATLQRRANQLTEQHASLGRFRVEVWAWEDVWHELYRRPELLRRIAPVYWPRRAALPPSPPSFADLVRDARPYLEYIAPQCQQLPLIGLDPKGKDSPLTLDAVYIGLDTKTQVHLREEHPSTGAEEEPLSALLAVALHRCVVLKGDPGSGKSTFISHLSYRLARHLLDPDAHGLGSLPGWPPDLARIPITITLREFVRAQPVTLPKPGPHCLWDYFKGTLAHSVLSQCSPALEQALHLGYAILFLDGLDEVPTEVQREFVRDCSLLFAERFPQARVVMTCRTIPFEAMLQEESEAQKANPRVGPRLADLTSFELAPFDDAKIGQFIAAWYRAHVGNPFTAETAEQRRDALQQAMGRRELRRLAGNPMLLTDMALLHTHRGRLPNDRARLYAEVIDLLLLRWEQAQKGTRRLGELLDDAERDQNDLLRTLAAVAFEVHGADRARSGSPEADEAGDIPHHTLLYALQELHPKRSLDWAQEVITTIEQRAGLLIDRGSHTYRFPHRSFQEYLAAVHLIKDKNFDTKATDLVDDSGYWREVIRWAAARLTHVDDVVEWKGFALIRKLCPGNQPPATFPWHRIWLAGEALLEMSLAKVTQFDEGPDLVNRVRTLLKKLLEAGALSPRERAQAAMALGGLGDDRSGVGVRPHSDHPTGVPDLLWTSVISPGPFVLGQGNELHSCEVIREPFVFSRYPVTGAQYQAFVEGGGYHHREYWTEEGWRVREAEGWTKPRDFSPEFQTMNHPRVGVSWYEAVAYCRWLNEAFPAEELKLPDRSWKVRLPSEAEWERAARDVDGREYPWGKGVEGLEDRCNVHETGFGRTSAVGMFPKGVAKCGAADMAGNVWEWTRSLWGKEAWKPEFGYPYRAEDGREDELALKEGPRVLRGGSWGNPAGLARCACRDWGEPVGRYGDVGFRLVASPFDSGC